MHAKLKEDNDKTVKRLDEAKQSETSCGWKLLNPE